MPQPKDRKAIEQAEKEIGENIPEGMKGLDTEDVGEGQGDAAPAAADEDR